MTYPVLQKHNFSAEDVGNHWRKNHIVTKYEGAEHFWVYGKKSVCLSKIWFLGRLETEQLFSTFVRLWGL